MDLLMRTKGSTIDIWFKNEDDEERMFDDHAYMWRHLIDAAPENDFSDFTILDYGCNRGRFFDVLHQIRPFKKGVGVDIAERSLGLARERRTDLPVEYILPKDMDRHAASVDVAFSHEVLYLLPNLDAHAAAIAQVLKESGAYYAAIGCHTGNPLWNHWRELIARSSNLPVFDYSLDDYARAFWKAGFRVDMRPFQLRDFILIKPNNAYFPQAEDSLAYHTNVKTIVRASMRPAVDGAVTHGWSK
jgi:SAM-dependent methyltransferase